MLWRIARVVALAVLLILIMLPGATTGHAQPVSDLRFGLVDAYAAGQAAYDSGASWEIITFRWDQLQPGAPGEWNADPAIDEWLAASRSAGREVVGVLVGTPSWATEGNPGTGVPAGLYLAANDPANTWASFVRQTVNYYSPRGINRWVIWREPNVPAGVLGYRWDGTVEDYYQLVKVAYVVAKNANPNALIHLGGVNEFDPAWFGRFLDVAIADITAVSNNYYFDVATVHAYFSPERVNALVANTYYLMDSKGVPLKEVWVNEIAARPAVDPDTYDTPPILREHQNISVEQQAAYIIQAYALAFDAGASRVAVRQLVDNLTADNQEAYGLIREDGTARPAYGAYQLVTRYFSGFVFARRVDEETFPLIDYVRLTGRQRVVHVAWARSELNATLIIPARTTRAALIDLYGNQWIVEPEGGEYRVVVGGAECNDPQEGCLIGGAPWLLVEEGVENPLDTPAPAVRVEQGGELPTPVAFPTPTLTPTLAPTETPQPSPTVGMTPTAPPTEEASPTAAVSSTEVAEVASEQPPAVPPQPDTLRPTGVQAMLPFGLIGLGVVVIAAGVVYYLAGRRAGEAASLAGEPADESGPEGDAGDKKAAPDDEGPEHDK